MEQEHDHVVNNVGVAFGLVIGAGLSTALGASVVFFPSVVKLASRRILASGLGLSAGVMIYVSLVEIFGSSTSAFQEAGHSEEDAYLYSTLCFFAGVAVMLIIDLFVRLVGPKNRRHYHKHSHGQERPADAECGEECTDGEDLVTPHCISCSPDPVGDLKVLQHEAEKIVARERHQCEHHDHDHHHASDANTSKNTSSESSDHGHNRDEENPAPASEEDQDDTEPTEDEDKKRLVKMGLNTALAISVHNFPEGLATFVAAVQEPRVGALLAIAIAIHNIPEGLCIALPIYYATGSRWKGFCWALLSGLTQPFAALVGWAALATAMSDEVYGILFGITTGLMVIISVRELIPTAHRYDPLDTVTTYSFIAGMVIMALSLVLFARSGNH